MIVKNMILVDTTESLKLVVPCLTSVVKTMRAFSINPPFPRASVMFPIASSSAETIPETYSGEGLLNDFGTACISNQCNEHHVIDQFWRFLKI